MSKSKSTEENKKEKMIGKVSEIIIETKFTIDPEDPLNITQVNYIKLYGLQLIFFVYFIQSLFFAIIHFQYYIDEPQKLFFYNRKEFILLIFIYGLFVLGMIKCTEKNCINCVISLLLVIFLTLLKIIVIGFLFEMVNFEYFKYSVEPDVYVYWNVITALVYMSLIIYNHFKNKYDIGVYFLIGFCYCFIGFWINFFKHDDIKNSIVFIILAGTEILYLIILIDNGIENSTLQPNESFWNIVYLDYYKYIILNAILLIFFYFLKCCCDLCIILGTNEDKKEKEPSKAKYMGPKGEIFDQYGKRIW